MIRPSCSWNFDRLQFFLNKKTFFAITNYNDEAQSQVVGTFTRACRVSGSHAKGKVKDSYGGRVGILLE